MIGLQPSGAARDARSVAVLLTCHNRRDKTLACLQALHANHLPTQTQLQVVLVDDGSSDGTGAAVRAQFPAVHLIQSDGSLYWNGGMRLAFEHAMAQGHDAYLWLNDDTLLATDALQRLLQCQAQVDRQSDHTACIVVGATCDAKTGQLTYGGLYDRGQRWNRHFAKLPVATVAQPCLSFNGNCVLVSAAAAHQLGNLDPQFVHGIGDWDYGLRATAAGVQVWVAPGFVGTCSHNEMPGFNAAGARGAVSRLRHVCSPKQLPLRAWRVYVQRHFPVLWPVYFARPYVGALTRDMVDRLRHLFATGRS